jgi:hypothetical protein
MIESQNQQVIRRIFASLVLAHWNFVRHSDFGIPHQKPGIEVAPLARQTPINTTESLT